MKKVGYYTKLFREGKEAYTIGLDLPGDWKSNIAAADLLPFCFFAAALRMENPFKPLFGEFNLGDGDGTKNCMPDSGEVSTPNGVCIVVPPGDPCNPFIGEVAWLPIGDVPNVMFPFMLRKGVLFKLPGWETKVPFGVWFRRPAW